MENINDSLIRQVGHTNSIEEAVGLSLYRFLNEADKAESTIGERKTYRLVADKGDYTVIGMQYRVGEAPISTITKENVNIEESQKFKCLCGIPAQDLVRAFMEKYQFEEIEEYEKQIEMIEKDKLLIMPIKPSALCRVYVGEPKNVDSKNEDTNTDEPNLAELMALGDTIDDESFDRLLEEKLNNASSIDSSNKMNRFDDFGKKSKHYYNKYCEYIPSNSIGNKSQERNVSIESVRYEVNRETGKIEAYIITKPVGTHPTKRVKASIEEYGVNILLDSIEGKHSVSNEIREFIRISRFGYIKPIKVNKGKAGYSIYIDNCFLYEEQDDEIKVIGFWNTNGISRLFTTDAQNKLKECKKLLDSLEYISQHRRYIAPLGLADYTEVTV